MSRKSTIIITAITHLLSLLPLLLAILGTTSPHTLPNLYFFNLDVSHIIPISVPNSPLLNSVARSLGLHDFYQTGLWNFCEGYLDTGITACSPPRAFFWFDPVSVLVAELLAGARIALPSQVVTLLRLLQAGQQVTYAFFLAAAVLEFLAMLLVPLVLGRRWFSAVLAAVAALAALLVCIAAAIASAISIAAKVALTAQDQLNIRVHVGIPMFVCVWIAAVMAVVAFVLQAALGCCCLPTRADGVSSAGPGPSSNEKYSYPFSVASITRRRNLVS